MRGNNIGATIRSMREARQFSRARFAHMAGLTAAGLARVEDEGAPIPAILLCRFATKLGVPLSALCVAATQTPPVHADCRGTAVH